MRYVNKTYMLYIFLSLELHKIDDLELNTSILKVLVLKPILGPLGRLLPPGA